MYALIDCNNFFVSCERVFNPSLCGRPVIVLSNNDGCVISRSNEAKALGIGMAVPFYQIKPLVKQHDVAVFSTNFTLYGDMSDRVMTVLSGFVPDMEVYSVDEAFLHLHGLDNLPDYAARLVRTVHKCTGIPVSIGVAPTKTLAKTANHFAKKYSGYKNVCLIDTEEKRIKALQQTEIGDVWGIGRQLRKTLAYYSIKTAYDLTLKSRSWVRSKMTVVGERTWLELQGTACLEKDGQGVDKQQICTSRSFGQPVTDFNKLLESLVALASLCVSKLRKQRSVAKGLYVLVQTNRFEDNAYRSSRVVSLPYPTSDLTEIVSYCRDALGMIYMEGLEYKRAGVILLDLMKEEHALRDLFDPIDREKRKRLTKALDQIAFRHGREAVKIAVEGEGYKPAIRQEHLSKRYTTNWDDLIEIKM